MKLVKNLGIWYVDNTYFLLANTKKIQVYLHNGKLLSEYHINYAEYAYNMCIARNKLIYKKVESKTAFNIVDINSGAKKRINLRKELDYISKIEKIDDDQIVIIGWSHIFENDQAIALESQIVMYNLIEDKIVKHLSNDLHINNQIITFNNKLYFLFYNNKDMLDIYCIEDNEFKKVRSLDLDMMTHFYLNKQIKNFIIIHDQSVINVIDMKEEKIIFSYDYTDKYEISSYARPGLSEWEGRIFLHLAISKIGEFNYETLFFDIQTGKLCKRLKQSIKVYNLHSNKILYQINKESGVRTIPEVFIIDC